MRKSCFRTWRERELHLHRVLSAVQEPVHLDSAVAPLLQAVHHLRVHRHSAQRCLEAVDGAQERHGIATRESWPIMTAVSKSIALSALCEYAAT